MTIKDDILSAYLDGELAPEDAERLRALLACDADLAQRFERLRLAGELAREAFEPLALARAPHALRAAAGASWSRFAAPAAAALAACAAGVVLGVSLRGEGSGRLFSIDGGIVAAPAVARALDDAATSATMRSGGVAVAPIYSFRDGDGRACRAFRASASDATVEGAACRDGAIWRILALAPTQARSGAFVQAGGDEPAAVAAAVDAAFAEEISAEEEAELIARGWR
jgi:hypothetical protein